MNSSMNPRETENEIQGLIADEMIDATDNGETVDRLRELSIKINKFFMESYE